MRPRRIANASSRALPDGESMVLTPEQERALVLNPAATAVWHLADGTRTLDQIGAFLSQQLSGATRERATADATKLVDELIEAGVLEDADGQA